MTSTTSPAPATPAAAATGGRDRTGWWLALLVLVAVGPFVQHLTAQPGSRLALTAALAEDGTLAVDRFEGIVGIDRLEVGGRHYSDKAPGQPVLAVPAYAAARALGAESAADARGEANLTLWWVTLWSATVPTAALAALVWSVVRRFDRAMATAATTLLVLGTLLLTFAGQLYGHALSVALGFAVWAVASSRPLTWRLAAAAGALAGVAVLVEYSMVVVAVVVGGWIATRRRWGCLAAYAAAGVPSLLALVAYQWALYGEPLSNTYSVKQSTADVPFLGLPTPQGLLASLLGSRGIFVLTPIVAIAVLGAVLLVAGRARTPEAGPAGAPGARVHALVGLVVFGAFAVAMAGWSNPWGGEMPGPRYLLPAVPFLAVGLTVPLRRWRLACLASAGLGLLVAGLSVLTLHLVPHGAQVIGTYLHQLRDGELTPTVLTLALGPAGWALHAALVGLVGLGVARSHRRAMLPGVASSTGTLFRGSTFGESHGPAVGVVVDGCPPRLPLSVADVQRDLDRRRPGQSRLVTQRDEPDRVEVLSGLSDDGRTLGTPIAMVVRNNDHRSGAYDHLRDVYRPSHADYTYDAKYGIRAVAGGGRASARETIGRVAAGAVARALLSDLAGVEVLAWVRSVHGIEADVDLDAVDLHAVEASPTRCPDPAAAERITEAIEAARRDGDSLGGVVEVVARNVPPGLGEPVFDKLEADLAKAVMSLPASKGVEVGSGFAGTLLTGRQHNDAFVPGPGGRPRTATNRSGGVQGGISNGEDVVLRVAFKPTATIASEQETVTTAGEPTTLAARGRHDPCVLPRAVPLVEAAVLLVVADHWLRQRALDALPRDPVG